MKQITYYVGTGFDKNSLRLNKALRRELILDAIDYLANNFSGVTLTKGKGSWVSPSKDVVTEPCAVFTVLTAASAGDIQDAAEFLKSLFNQESIGVSEVDAKVRFV